jgi:hypothetical protein
LNICFSKITEKWTLPMPVIIPVWEAEVEECGPRPVAGKRETLSEK